MTTIERALQLADAGRHRTVGEIKRTLGQEGHLNVHGYLSGKAIRDQLTARIAAARGQ